MVRLFVRHNVSDYGAWRRAYDDFDATRREMGVTDDAIYQDVTDSNDVTVTHDFESTDEAAAFVKSSELRGAMADAGVIGTPQIWITELA